MIIDVNRKQLSDNREGGKNIDNQGNSVLTNLLNFAPYTDLVVTSGNFGSILLGNDDTTKKLRLHKNIGINVLRHSIAMSLARHK